MSTSRCPAASTASTASRDWSDLFPVRPDAPPLRIVLHAPTPGALARARSNRMGELSRASLAQHLKECS